ncbi:MAG: histidine kinase [Enhydrobacter sp.]|nr:histidine kinase [Enhydrobacter sp.]
MQAVGWGLFTLVDLIDRGITFHSLGTSLLLTMLVAPCCVLLSSAMGAAYARQSPTNELAPRTLVLIALLSLGSAATAVALLFTVRHLVGLTVPEWSTAQEIGLPLIHYSLAFVGWSLCYFWIRAEIAERAEHRHAVKAEAEALRAELEELRLQLDPHFLFNALNGVAEEIPEHPEAALAMLRDLTAYLRHSLAGIHQPVVAASVEAEALAAYLRIQQARFGPRLATRIQVEPAAASCRIASFLLQPLVENAVKHGKRDDVLQVAVEICLARGALQIEITNSGALAGTKPPRNRSPIGLENVRRRLALYYPDRHHFTLAERGNQVVASLVLQGPPCES